MQEDRYFIVYDWMVQAVGNANSALALALIYGLCTKQGGSCAITNAYIAERIGCKECWARRIVNELIANGFVTKTSGVGRGVPSVYTLTEKVVQMTHLLEKKRGTNVPLIEEKKGYNNTEKGVQMYHQNINNNKINSSSSSTPAHTQEGKEIAFAWLTDNEERMAALCMQNRIPLQGTLTETLRPFIDDFLQGETAAGTDWYLEDAQDVRRHFANWLRQNKERVTQKQQDNDITRDTAAPDAGTENDLPKTFFDGYDPSVGENLRRRFLNFSR